MRSLALIALAMVCAANAAEKKVSASLLARRAQKTMDYNFTVCGVPHQFKDHKIDWEFNPTYNNYREWPWQFARHSFLSSLSDYYLQTKDEKAAETYVAIVESFIDGALPPPPGTGPGKTKSWRTIDTGLRATSWVNTYAAFTNSPAWTPAFVAKFNASLKDHVTRLIPKQTSNNWRIMELRGLTDLVLAFPWLDPEGTVLAQCEREFEGILTDQLYPDGFQFELAPGYHSILDGDYCAVANRYRQFGRQPPKFFETGVQLAFELYPHLTRPDRALPAINDSNKYPIQQRMQRAAELFPNRKDFLWFATDGKEGAPPPYLTYIFPYAGAVAFRDSWAKDAVWGYVDMSPFGRGHQHEDKLNFLLHAYGKDMLIEGGCYAYDTSDMRRYVISTRAHNTIMIDGKEQNARKTWKWLPEMLHQKADIVSSLTPAVDTVESTFALGYGKDKAYSDAVSHTRKVEFIKNDGAPYFRITDTLTAKDAAPHTYEQLWHVEKCEFALTGTAFTADFGNGVTLEASFTSENGRLTDHMGQKEPVYQGWMPISPPGPHEHRPVHTPILKGTFTGTTTITVLFRPRRNVK